MTFQPLTLGGAKAVLELRNRYAAALRTGQPVNEEDQETWWFLATQKDANQRWWEIVRPRDDDSTTVFEVVGYCGVEHIDWIARTGEMSLLLDGSDAEWNDAFDFLFNQVFNTLNLREVHAEVYHCSPDLERWRSVAETFRVEPITLPLRKFHDGRMWDADYLSWRLPS